MTDGLNPFQVMTLCFLFVGIHLLAVPPFLWAIRHGQFRGKEQAQWTLNDPESPLAPPAKTRLTPRRAQIMLATMATLAVLMLASVVLTLFLAMSAPAHPAAAQCPF